MSHLIIIEPRIFVVQLKLPWKTSPAAYITPLQAIGSAVLYCLCPICPVAIYGTVIFFLPYRVH